MELTALAVTVSTRRLSQAFRQVPVPELPVSGPVREVIHTALGVIVATIFHSMACVTETATLSTLPSGSRGGCYAQSSQTGPKVEFCRCRLITLECLFPLIGFSNHFFVVELVMLLVMLTKSLSGS